MEIEEKLENIESLIEKLGFKVVLRDDDYEYLYRTGSGDKILDEFRLFEKRISDTETICIRLRTFVKFIVVPKTYNTINVFHIRDGVKCFYLFERDTYIEMEYEFIMNELKEKFKYDLRKEKINNLFNDNR